MINCIFYGFKPNKIDAWYSIEYVSQYIDNVILYMDFCILYYICSTESRLYRRIQYRSLRWSWWGKQAGEKMFFMKANNYVLLDNHNATTHIKS